MRVSIILATLPLLASASPLGHADLEERGNSFCKFTNATTIGTVFSTVTQTVTNSAESTQTCYAAPVLPKRHGHPFGHFSGHRRPNNMPWYWEDSAISSACSCLSIFAPSTIKTVTTTLKTSTVNIVSTISLKPVITSVLTSIKTSNCTGNSTTTIFSTVTQTATATATQLSPNGLKFGTFTHSFNDDDAVDEADPSYFKGKTPEHSGVIEDLNFSSGQSSQINIGGQVIPSAFQAVLAQGYFLARTVGTYTFTTSGDIVDNWVFLWHGNAAFSNWDKNNTDYESFGGRPEPNVDGSLTLTLDAGDAVPITFLWLNGAGQGTSNLYITTPEGQTFTNTTGWFIQACSNSTFS
ncbi:putative PA14 domain-containing protein [Seiridium unicorne]|uniref:PA14 domain-containing protein n=1 Tax=Seiridium unicorne TaxID=138068 RepID=A0ABR2VIK3_9PEZI